MYANNNPFNMGDPRQRIVPPGTRAMRPPGAMGNIRFPFAHYPGGAAGMSRPGYPGGGNMHFPVMIRRPQPGPGNFPGISSMGASFGGIHILPAPVSGGLRMMPFFPGGLPGKGFSQPMSDAPSGAIGNLGALLPLLLAGGHTSSADTPTITPKATDRLTKTAEGYSAGGALFTQDAGNTPSPGTGGSTYRIAKTVDNDGNPVQTRFSEDGSGQVGTDNVSYNFAYTLKADNESSLQLDYSKHVPNGSNEDTYATRLEIQKYDDGSRRYNAGLNYAGHTTTGVAENLSIQPQEATFTLPTDDELASWTEVQNTLTGTGTQTRQVTLLGPGGTTYEKSTLLDGSNAGQGDLRNVVLTYANGNKYEKDLHQGIIDETRATLADDTGNTLTIKEKADGTVQVNATGGSKLDVTTVDATPAEIIPQSALDKVSG